MTGGFVFASLAFLPAPFIWGDFAISGLMFWFTLRLRTRAPKLISLNLALLFIGLSGLEAIVYWRSSRRAWGQGTESQYVVTRSDGQAVVGTYLSRRADVQVHPVLGYGPSPGVNIHAMKRRHGELVYDATYSVNDQGLRSTPVIDSQRCVLFFGGSFTYGQGVGDEETTPYRVALGPGVPIQTFNFGFEGYGPHHMLAAIENGLVAGVVGRFHPTIAVYLAIPHHVKRCAGRIAWPARLHQPRYRLQNGHVMADGFFDDDPILAQFRKSALYERLLGARARPSERDRELFTAIVVRSEQLLKARFPETEFHVICWDVMAETNIHDMLTAAGLTVHRISEMLPDFDRERDLLRHDGHPNASCHGKVARYIRDRIVNAR